MVVQLLFCTCTACYCLYSLRRQSARRKCCLYRQSWRLNKLSMSLRTRPVGVSSINMRRSVHIVPGLRLQPHPQTQQREMPAPNKQTNKASALFLGRIVYTFMRTRTVPQPPLPLVDKVLLSSTVLCLLPCAMVLLKARRRRWYIV